MAVTTYHGGVGDEGVDQEAGSQIEGSILALLDELLQTVAIVGTFLNFHADEVTGGDVSVTEFLNELLALSSFSTSGSTYMYEK